MKNIVIGIIIGALSCFLLNKHLSRTAMESYKAEKELLNQEIEQVKVLKKKDSLAQVEKLQDLQNENKAIKDSITQEEKQLKKDEEAIINYSGDFNKRFDIFSNLIPANQN